MYKILYHMGKHTHARARARTRAPHTRTYHHQNTHTPPVYFFLKIGFSLINNPFCKHVFLTQVSVVHLVTTHMSSTMPNRAICYAATFTYSHGQLSMVFICSLLQQSVVTADGRRWAKFKRLMVYFMDDNFSLCLWGTVRCMCTFKLGGDTLA